VHTPSEKSTIVRTGEDARQTPGADPRLFLIRRVFRLLEPVAPGLGSRLAWKLWTRTVEPDARAVERSRAAGMGEVRRLRLKLPDWTGTRPTGPDGEPKAPLTTDIVVELLGPQDGPLVYLLHGWGGWRGQFAPIGRALAARGFRAVLIDAPNHGDSGGGTLGEGIGTLPDFTLTLAAVVRELGPAYAVVGHSLGGGCSAFAILGGLEARRAVFIAPAVNPEAFTKELAAMLGYGERIRTRMVDIAMRRTGYAPADFVLPARLAARGDLPDALILHDAEDPVIPVSDGRSMAASWRGARLVVTSGLGHNRILRHDASAEAVADFIAGDEAHPAPDIDIAGFARGDG
jgi:pimeloyl-ACP methyl ester carboxylesterase